MDESSLVERLGAFPLAVEILPFDTHGQRMRFWIWDARQRSEARKDSSSILIMEIRY